MVQTECRELVLCRGAAHPRSRIAKFGCKGTKKKRNKKILTRNFVFLQADYGNY
jgi:hypothetical protein